MAGELPIVARCCDCLRGYVSRSSTSPDPRCFTCGGPILMLEKPEPATNWDELRRPFAGDREPPKDLRERTKFVATFTLTHSRSIPTPPWTGCPSEDDPTHWRPAPAREGDAGDGAGR